MKTTFRKSFLRDLKKIKSRPLRELVQEAIEQVEAAAQLQQVASLKRMSGTSTFYRIRIGDYRVVYAINDRARTIIVERVGHRRDIYRRVTD